MSKTLKSPLYPEVWFVADYDDQAFSEAESNCFQTLSDFDTALPTQLRRVYIPQFDTYSCGFLLYQIFAQREETHNVVVFCNVHPRFPQDANREVGSRFLCCKLKNGIYLFANDCGYNLSVLHQEGAIEKFAEVDIEQFGYVHTQFHGRDSYMPMVARILAGDIDLEESLDWEDGADLNSVKELDEGKCVYIDNYGNCKIYANQEWLADKNALKFKQYVIPFVETIGEDIQGVRCVVGSSGPRIDQKGTWLELQVLGGNASKILGMRKGDRVKAIHWDDAEK